MIIGIWCGNGKAPLNEYLRPLINELMEFQVDDLIINDCRIKVQFGRCICDTPARSYLKGKLFLKYCDDI